MDGIGIKEIKMVRITTSDGLEIDKDDLLCIQVKGEDVICRFVTYDSAGYIVTRAVAHSNKEIKYRPSSITACYKVKAFELDTAENRKAAQEVAITAVQDVLQPGA